MKRQAPCPPSGPPVSPRIATLERVPAAGPAVPQCYPLNPHPLVVHTAAEALWGRQGLLALLSYRGVTP
jgi:hypothetical protein